MPPATPAVGGRAAGPRSYTCAASQARGLWERRLRWPCWDLLQSPWTWEPWEHRRDAPSRAHWQNPPPTTCRSQVTPPHPAAAWLPLFLLGPSPSWSTSVQSPFKATPGRLPLRPPLVQGRAAATLSWLGHQSSQPQLDLDASQAWLRHWPEPPGPLSSFGTSHWARGEGEAPQGSVPRPCLIQGDCGHPCPSVILLWPSGPQSNLREDASHSSLPSHTW